MQLLINNVLYPNLLIEFALDIISLENNNKIHCQYHLIQEKISRNYTLRNLGLLLQYKVFLFNINIIRFY